MNERRVSYFYEDTPERAADWAAVVAGLDHVRRRVYSVRANFGHLLPLIVTARIGICPVWPDVLWIATADDVRQALMQSDPFYAEASAEAASSPDAPA